MKRLHLKHFILLEGNREAFSTLTSGHTLGPTPGHYTGLRVLVHLCFGPSKLSVSTTTTNYNVKVQNIIHGVFFNWYPPKSTKKLILARLGVSRPIYVNVDSPNQ